MRDIFTMGARPIANLNSLRFGHPKDKKTKYLLQKGIKAKSELTKAKISSKLRVEFINSITQENSYILNIERK